MTPGGNGNRKKVDDTKDPQKTFHDPRNEIRKFLEGITGKTFRRLDNFEKLENLLYLSIIQNKNCLGELDILQRQVSELYAEMFPEKVKAAREAAEKKKAVKKAIAEDIIKETTEKKEDGEK